MRPCCHIVCIVVSGADHPGKAKVTELHHTVLGYQDVLRLYVPDDDDDDHDDDHDHDDDDNLCRQL